LTIQFTSISIHSPVAPNVESAVDGASLLFECAVGAWSDGRWDCKLEQMAASKRCALDIAAANVALLELKGENLRISQLNLGYVCGKLSSQMLTNWDVRRWIGPDLFMAERKAHGDLMIHLNHQRVLRGGMVRVGMMWRRRWMMEYRSWVHFPRARWRLLLLLQLLLLLITESLSSDGRRILLTIMIMTWRQTAVLMVMIIVLVLNHRLIVDVIDVIIVVLPNGWRRLTHSLKSATFPGWAVRLDIRAVCLIATVLVIAWMWTYSLTVVSVSVGWSIFHHVGITVRWRWCIVVVLVEGLKWKTIKVEFKKNVTKHFKRLFFLLSLSPFADPSSKNSSFDRPSCFFGPMASPNHQHAMSAAAGLCCCQTDYHNSEWRCAVDVQTMLVIDVVDFHLAMLIDSLRHLLM
jgi:hypothetical protein